MHTNLQTVVTMNCTSRSFRHSLIQMKIQRRVTSESRCYFVLLFLVVLLLLKDTCSAAWIVRTPNSAQSKQLTYCTIRHKLNIGQRQRIASDWSTICPGIHKLRGGGDGSATTDIDTIGTAMIASMSDATDINVAAPGPALLISLFAGSIAGALGIGVAYPLDTLKTKQQVMSTGGRSVFHLSYAIYMAEGIAGFYGGVKVSKYPKSCTKNI